MIGLVANELRHHKFSKVKLSRSKGLKDSMLQLYIVRDHQKKFAKTLFQVCTQTRLRVIELPPLNGGDDCWGEAAEERFCQSQLCQGTAKAVKVLINNVSKY